MVNLTPKDKRIDFLMKHGAPETFVKNIGHIQELKYLLEGIDAAYHYLPKLASYKVLKGLQITPIYCEGTSFWVLGTGANAPNIFRFELENDEVYQELGTNWQQLLFELMFQYFEDEIENGLTLDGFVKVGELIGFNNSKLLFEQLNIPVDDYNKRWNELEQWKKELIELLNIN